MAISTPSAPTLQLPLLPPGEEATRTLRTGLLLGLGLLGFFLAAGGTISLPVGGAVSLLWPAVAVQFVLALWLGWAGVLVGVLFPLASNLLVADPVTALAFSPANALQSLIPLLVFRLFRLFPLMRQWRQTALLALASLLASTAAAVVGTSLQAWLWRFQGPDPWPLAITWAITNTLSGFFLSWPLLRWVSPVLWEVAQVQRLGRGKAFGVHLLAGALTLASVAVAVAIVFQVLVVRGLPIPSQSLAGVLGLVLLPVAALGIHVLWRYLAAPLEQLLADAEKAVANGMPVQSPGFEPAEFKLLRVRFAEVLDTLRQQEARFRQLFETVGEPIMLTDPQGRLLDANPAFERLFSVPVARARGRNLVAFNESPAREQLQAILSGPPPKEPVTLRARVRIWGKGVKQVHLTAAPWYDRKGIFAGYCVVTADITREEEAAQREELAARLASLQHLLAGLAHEGNNILQAGLSGLENLLARHPHMAQEFTSLREVVHRGQALLRRVSLLAGERERLPSEAFSAAELLVGVTAAMGSYPSIPLQLHQPPEYPVIRGDRHMLREAVEAVVRNALEACREGGKVTVRFDRAEVQGEGEGLGLAPGPYLVVSVEDTGTGISPEDLLHVFDPFFTTRDRTVHQGVGLTLARAAARHAGGTIAVHSPPGRGTRVHLWLPIAGSTPPVPAVAPLTKARVLLVDDDPQVRQGLEGILRELKMEPISAGSGGEAMALLTQSTPVDVVILDLLMPEVSGFDVLQVIRQTRPDLPVILSSGYAPDERVREALQRPSTFFLQKPYTLRQLEDTLAQALEASRAHS
ncbi:MAG: response regulator [Thermoanaerobaculum sp.]|nr:response regulator [Thermoanaerobaculum sp.]